MTKRKYERDDTVGKVVWSKLRSNNWWPGIIVDPCDAGLPVSEKESGNVYVFWFGDYRISKVHERNIQDFKANFKACCKKKKNTKIWSTGLLEAIRECGLPHTLEWSPEKLLAWAHSQFGNVDGVDFSTSTNGVSNFVAEKLKVIAEINEDDEEENEKPEPTANVKSVLSEAISAKKPCNVCLACYTQQDVVEDHPIFDGKICSKCKKRIQSAMYTCGDDGVYYYCAVCAFPGEMIVCSAKKCGRVFCKNCFDHLTAPGARTQILRKNPWDCFFCEKQAFGGLIQKRTDWRERVSGLFKTEKVESAPPLPQKRTKLRVLSLFDGIGTGLYVLEKLNIDVDVYYAYEIDEDAINVVKSQFHDRITCMGNVKSLDEKSLKELLPIDLLLGGPPCNDFSLANPKRKGLFDFSGSGTLFFDFYRVLMLLKFLNKRPFFWLMENVAAMPSKMKEDISRFLGCEPKIMNAISVSPQNRARLFWGNLPSLLGDLPVVEDETLQNYLMPSRVATVKKLRTVTTRTNSLKQGPDQHFPVRSGPNVVDTVWVTELEQIFGFPAHYTDVGNISVTKRQGLIGKSWSAQVIQYLFNFLSNYFLSNSE